MISSEVYTKEFHSPSVVIILFSCFLLMNTILVSGKVQLFTNDVFWIHTFVCGYLFWDLIPLWFILNLSLNIILTLCLGLYDHCDIVSWFICPLFMNHEYLCHEKRLKNQYIDQSKVIFWWTLKSNWNITKVRSDVCIFHVICLLQDNFRFQQIRCIFYQKLSSNTIGT